MELVSSQSKIGQLVLGNLPSNSEPASSHRYGYHKYTVNSRDNRPPICKNLHFVNRHYIIYFLHCYRKYANV